MVPYPKLENMTNWWHEMATLQISFTTMAKKKPLTTTVLLKVRKIIFLGHFLIFTNERFWSISYYKLTTGYIGIIIFSKLKHKLCTANFTSHFHINCNRVRWGGNHSHNDISDQRERTISRNQNSNEEEVQVQNELLSLSFKNLLKHINLFYTKV